MTYPEYLMAWKRRYGNATYGRAEYLTYGVQTQTTLHRLSISEFDEKLAALQECDRKFGEAREKGDPDGMDNALIESFNHELVLLV